MINFLQITEFIHNRKWFKISSFWSLCLIHFLLFSDVQSLMIERNKPQESGQGYSHLTLHVKCIQLCKGQSSVVSLTNPGQMKEESWEWRCALGDSAHFIPGKRDSLSRMMLFFFTRHEKVNKEPVQLSIYIELVMRILKAAFVDHM